MIRQCLKAIRGFGSRRALPAAARSARREDRRGLPALDPGPERAIAEAVGWLGRAQDHSRSNDGGVASHYSLVDGWSASYPETTGYIVPTLLAFADYRGGDAATEARRRARRMLDWLISIQFPRGGFQGGLIDSEPVVPVTFNTGQILLGLAAGAREFGDAYLDPARRAADWLVETQDPDGCWRKYPTPFACVSEKVYETHVGWGLLEAARLVPDPRYAEAALTNVRWALGFQRENGWFDKCFLVHGKSPFTHTIGYALRGVVEAYQFTRDPALLNAARKTADGLLGALRPDGFLPGRIDKNWKGVVPWACLTGTVQVAHCWLLLYQETGEGRYREAGFAANRYVRRTLKTDGPPETRGGVKGSFPIDGEYGSFRYLNWACKFLIDSQLLELSVRSEAPHPVESAR